MKLPLTDALVRTTPAPTKAQRVIELRDASCRGLVVRITHTDVRTFDFRYRAEGRDERVVIGRYGDITLKDARH
jgi:hypothetical protein